MAPREENEQQLEDTFLKNEEWKYPGAARSGWLPLNAQAIVDAHPWTRCAIEKNPRFPGYVPPEALFCWSEADFASYISSGGFVKPKLQCQYFISPESPQAIVDLLVPIIGAMNWTCSVDTDVGREETKSRTDYHGMPISRFQKCADGSLVESKPSAQTAPIFIWEGGRRLIKHAPTLKHGGLVNRLTGIAMFTKIGMLDLVRERCIERDLPIAFPPPWFPLTFALPDDLEQWKGHVQSHPYKKWIYKPTGESMGRGIMLVNRISDVDSKDRPFRTRCKDVEVFDPKESPLQERDFAKSGVIQEYVVNPMLLDNRKFAVRVYLLVARVEPYLTFHYNFGYIKRCSEHYDENKFEREDLFRHITNQEFQKKRAEFDQTTAAELLSMEELDEYLQTNMGIPSFRLNFWQQVKKICVEVCLGMRDQVSEHRRPGMFEVFGLDFIVDAEQRVRLLEANRDPSWVMDTPVKAAIIPDMLKEMLALVFWAHSEKGQGREATLAAPAQGFEVLLDDAFDFQAVDVD